MSTAAQALILAITAIVCAGQPIQSSYSEIRRLRGIEKQGRLGQSDRKRLGLAYHAAGQHLLFRKVMLDAIAADPADAEPHFYLGRHYVSDVSDFATALVHFRAAVERRPAAEYRAYLAYSLEMLGEKEQALALYRKSEASEPCGTLTLAGLARLQAITPEKIAGCRPDHPVVLRELAKLLSARGRHAEAAAFLERVLAQEPSSASNAYQLHRAYKAAGNEPKARAALAEFKRLSSIYGGQ